MNTKQPTSANGTNCDTCGRWFTFWEMAETIEEYLCEECASGISDDDCDDDSYDWSEDYD